MSSCIDLAEVGEGQALAANSVLAVPIVALEFPKPSAEASLAAVEAEGSQMLATPEATASCLWLKLLLRLRPLPLRTLPLRTLPRPPLLGQLPTWWCSSSELSPILPLLPPANGFAISPNNS